MGILLHKNSIAGDQCANADDENIFKDAIDEIRDIIKGSELERKSRDTIENGFELDIIKTDHEKTHEVCRRYNQYFNNKFFEPANIKGELHVYCKNYYDKIDVSIGHRITIFFMFPDYHLRNVYYAFKPKINEYMYQGFKFYWNHHTSTAHIYKDTRHRIWKSQLTEEASLEHAKQVLSKFINDLKPFMSIK